jgi:hypothetical protein
LLRDQLCHLPPDPAARRLHQGHQHQGPIRQAQQERAAERVRQGDRTVVRRQGHDLDAGRRRQARIQHRPVLQRRELDELRRRFDVADGDVLIMIADPSYAVVTSALGSCVCIWPTAGLIPAEHFCPVWVTDFPLFEADRGGRRHLQPPSVHRAGPHGFRSEERGGAADAALAGLRSGRQRRGTGRRQHPYQQPRRAAQDVHRAGVERRRDPGAVRLLPAGVRFRPAAAWRVGAGHGPHRVDDPADSVDPRGDRVSRKTAAPPVR